MNPQPSDPKFSLIHNEINQQGVKRLENKAFPLSLFISVQLISYQCGNKDGNNEPAEFRDVVAGIEERIGPVAPLKLLRAAAKR